MKYVRSRWKRISIVLAAAVLFCLSAFAVMAAEAVTTTETGVQLITGVPEDDEQVRFYTYTIYHADGSNAGTIELRYGTKTGHYGVRMWIKTDASPVEIEYENRNFTVNTQYLTVKNATWTSFFTETGYTYSVEEKILPEIQAVKSVSWDSSRKPGILVWDEVDEAEGGYKIDLLIDGSKKKSVSTPDGRGTKDFSDDINESGSYTVSIISVGGKTTGDSKAAVSTAYVYSKPADKVGKTTKVWWTTKEGETLPTVINWNPVAGAEGYKITLRAVKDGVTQYAQTIYNTGSGLATSLDWSYEIKKLNTQEGEALTYICSVRALAGNIEVVANASESESVSSEEYATSDIISEIKETLKNSGADTIIKDIEEAGVDSVAAAMQTDKDTLEKVAALEAEFAAANNITVQPPEVTHSGIDADKIRVVGTGINAVSGSAVRLDFSQVSDEKEINEKLYENVVQVSITLKNGEETVTGPLKCPVTITMLPPAGVDLARLVILHYHSDGTVETLYPAKNADGTITFSVTSFSDFVFADLVQYNGSDSNSGGNNDNDNDNDDADDDADDDRHYSYSASESYSARDIGVQIYGTTKKFVKADGTFAVSEWVKKGNTWYYAGADGVLQTGWYQNAGGVWYYLKDTCEMATGWQFINGKWYYLDPLNGDMKTGWLQTADGKWYFLRADGDMKTGWLRTADGKWYYLGADGACLMNTTTPDGYKVDANGAWAG